MKQRGKHLVSVLSTKEDEGTLGLMWQIESEVEDTLAKIQSQVRQPKLTWLVLSERSTNVWSIVQQPIFMKKLPNTCLLKN